MQPGKGFAPQSGRTAAVLAAATRGTGPTTRLHQPPQLPRALARGTHHLTPAGPGREPPVDGGHPIPAVVVRAGARIAVPRPPVQLHEQRSAACRRSWRPARVCCWLSPNGGPCGRSTPLTKRSSSTLSAPAAVGVSTSIRSERQRCRAGPASASRNDAGAVSYTHLDVYKRQPETFVGGTEARQVDADDAASRDRGVIFPLILGLVLLSLVLLLRSLVAPIVLVGTVVLTFLAALGVSWWIFTKVFNFSALDVSTPLYTCLLYTSRCV